MRPHLLANSIRERSQVRQIVSMVVVLFHASFLLIKQIYDYCLTWVKSDDMSVSDAEEARAIPAKERADVAQYVNEANEYPPREEWFKKMSASPVRFSPPVYLQRYCVVADLIGDVARHGTSRKVVEYGCAELNMIRYLKYATGVEQIFFIDIDRQVLEQNVDKVKPISADYIQKRSAPLEVEIYEGCVTFKDKRLQDVDAVFCIELIEHLHQEVLEQLPSNIFGYIQPNLVIITTPNANFNVCLRPTRYPNSFRHPDHKFEWTRSQFERWAKNITTKYPYNVVFDGIGYGPKDTRQFGACTQLAIFYRHHGHKRDKTYQTREGISGLLKPVYNKISYPYHIDTRSDEQKLLDRAIYYINRLRGEDPFQDAIPLHSIASFMPTFAPSIEVLKKVLEEAGWTIETQKDEFVVLVPESSVDSDEFDDSYNNLTDGHNSIFDEHENSEDELDCNEDWADEPSIVIPQNYSITQDNTYLFDGEDVEEECPEFEDRLGSRYDNNEHSNISNNEECILSADQELPSNSRSIALFGTEVDVDQTNVSSSLINKISSCSNNLELNDTTKNLPVDNIMMQLSPSRDVDTSFKTVQTDCNSSSSKIVPYSLKFLTTTIPEPYNTESDDDYSENDEYEVFDDPLLNSTYREVETTNEPSINNSSKEDVLRDKESVSKDDNMPGYSREMYISEEQFFLKCFAQDSNAEYSGEKDAINRGTSAMDIINAVQGVDAHRDLSSYKNLKHKEESVNCTPVTALARIDDEKREHLKNTMNSLAQPNTSAKLSRELNSIPLNVSEYNSSNLAKEEINSLENTFQSCESDAYANTIIQFTSSVLKDDEHVEYNVEDSTSKDISIASISGKDNVETKPFSSTFETPPDSLSHEIMDSGYPNSVSAQDITPENDLSSIAQDHIPDIESPSIAEAPRFGILEPIEVENGDLANNNRDDEGNNMIAAMDANDIEGLQPLIDVLENDLENENDIYALENGFPMWLLRILDMANPLDFEVQPQLNLMVPYVVGDYGDDANYMGHDEGFDSSSDNGSDIANNEINKECGN